MATVEQDDEPSPAMGPPGIETVSGIARIAAGAWLRGATWGLGTTVKATRRLGEAAVSGESAAQLIDELREEALENLRLVLGVVEREPRAAPITDAFNSIVPERRPAPDPDRDTAESLRDRGTALLERAAEVDRGGTAIHPGFDRIIDQLAPDEARILKLLGNDGPQPIVYIHRAAPMGLGAREIARRLSLIGREAGCLRPELLPAYIDNLVRLGLIAIRRDPVADEQAYEVVEAQPEVIEALRSVSGTLFRGQISRRSVHLSDFGRTFCQVCFPPGITGEFEAVMAEAEPDPPPPAPGLPGAPDPDEGAERVS
jgi:hypothetical protein